MNANSPSRTAFGAAIHRAAHQVLDDPPIFEDPLALRIVGEVMAGAIRSGDPRTQGPGLRPFLAARSRFAEDALTDAFGRGVRQYVLLGAGLDTFAYRAGSAFAGLSVLEVDHPATQEWKRELLRQAGIAVPESVTYAPVDFERESVAEGLARAGFDPTRPAFFAWLGVVPYLTREAVIATLGFVAQLEPGTEIVFDYPEPAESDDAQRHPVFARLAARAAEAGEPFRSFFDPAALARDLSAIGLAVVCDLDSEALNTRYFQGRRDGLRLAGRSHLAQVRVPPVQPPA